MNKIKQYNEQVLIQYLSETEKECPDLLKLIYPFTAISIDYLSVFDDDLELDEEYLILDKCDIKTNMKLVREFLKELFPEYLDEFEKSITDGTFDIFYMEYISDSDERIDEPITVEGEDNTYINLPLTNTFDDGATILHEFFHFTNRHGTGVREIFTELISIYVEFRYFMYLNDKGYTLNSYYKNLYNRLKCTYNSASNIAYAGSMLDIYYNTGKLDKRNIKFIDKYRDLYLDNIESIIKTYSDENIEDLIYGFHNDVSYLIGGIIGLNLLDNSVINDIKIKYINSKIDRLTIREILNILDINIYDFQELIDKCKKEFYLIKGDNHEKSYMYSRSNGCR